MYYIKRIEKYLYNMLEYIKEHFVRIIIILLFFIILCIVFCAFPKSNITENNVIIEQHILILGVTLENWFTYLSVIAIVITAIWAIYQFDKSIARRQQEKAAEIAKIFSQDLLMKCKILGNVILDSGIDSLFKLEELDYREFKNFDRSEIYNIYSDDTMIIKLKEKLFSLKTQQIYLHYLEQNISLKPLKDFTTYSEEESKKLFVLDNCNMPFKFYQLVSSVLNELEYISMYIASQSAGSKYVYQSLHQMFLRTVKLLAPIISMQNKDYSDKYYTNIIHVYNEWSNLREINVKKEKKKKDKANKILNPKIKTV